MNTNTAYKEYPAKKYEIENKEIHVDEQAEQFTYDNLLSILQTIDGAMNESPSIILSCFELHLPDDSPLLLDYYSSNVVVKFLQLLKYRSALKHKYFAGGNSVKMKANIDFVWNKKITKNGKPFYQIMLLLNREAYDNQGFPNNSDEDTFLFRLYSTWAMRLNITEAEARKLVQFSGKKISFMGNEAKDITTVFEKASIFYKEPATDHDTRCYGFGTSR